MPEKKKWCCYTFNGELCKIDHPLLAVVASKPLCNWVKHKAPSPYPPISQNYNIRTKRTFYLLNIGHGPVKKIRLILISRKNCGLPKGTKNPKSFWKWKNPRDNALLYIDSERATLTGKDKKDGHTKNH